MSSTIDNEQQSPVAMIQDMPLTTAVSQYAQDQEWREEISIDHANRCSTLSVGLSADGHRYRLYIETSDEDEVIAVFIYTPFAVPPDRMGDAARLLNRINDKLRLGRLTCADDGDSNPVQYRVAFDFTGAQCSLRQIGIMVDAGMWTLRHYGKAIAAVALADLSADESWTKYLNCEASKTASAEVPTRTLQ